MPLLTIPLKKEIYSYIFNTLTSGNEAPEIWLRLNTRPHRFQEFFRLWTPKIFKGSLRAIETQILIAQADGSEKVFQRRFVVQNPNKFSRFAYKARKGSKIVHMYGTNEYDRIEDGVILSLK